MQLFIDPTNPSIVQIYIPYPQVTNLETQFRGRNPSRKIPGSYTTQSRIPFSILRTSILGTGISSNLMFLSNRPMRSKPELAAASTGIPLLSRRPAVFRSYATRNAA